MGLELKSLGNNPGLATFQLSVLGMLCKYPGLYSDGSTTEGGKEERMKGEKIRETEKI